MTDLLYRFARLFSGRLDAYGSELGGCIREPVVEDVWRGHLEGWRPIGIYPLSEGQVRWGAVDIDTHGTGLTTDQAHVQAVNLQRVLAALHLTGWIEVSRSDGRHVWVFAKDWVPAVTMRHALLLACQVAGVDPREVNPKQTEAVAALGNYVRLPYPGAMKRFPTRQMMVDEVGRPWGLASFIAAAEVPVGDGDLETAAHLYVPPPPTRRHQVSVEVGDLDIFDEVPERSSDLPPSPCGRAARKLDGLAWEIFRNGPSYEGKGRYRTLCQLARLCFEQGLEEDEAFLILSNADWRWGKLLRGLEGGKDGEAQILKIIGKAFG